MLGDFGAVYGVFLERSPWSCAYLFSENNTCFKYASVTRQDVFVGCHGLALVFCRVFVLSVVR